jgi:hypothetical protein
VLVLPTSILTADLVRAVSTLQKVKTPGTDGEKTQAAFQAELVELVAGGPGAKSWDKERAPLLSAIFTWETPRRSA